MRKPASRPKRVRRSRRKRPWSPVETDEAIDDGDETLSDKENGLGPDRDVAKAEGAE